MVRGEMDRAEAASGSSRNQILGALAERVPPDAVATADPDKAAMLADAVEGLAGM